MLARDIAPDRRELPAVLCSSRLDPKKNHIELVRAYAGSPQLQAAANLLIVVRGAEDIHSRDGLTPTERAVLDQVVAVCQENDLWGQVSAFSLASQGELAAAYRYLSGRRSAFALTALYEPFGLAPLEAMASGLPAVVTQNGGPSESLRDLVTGREFGVLVDPADPSDIAAGLLRLVGPGNEWEAFHQAGRERVLAKYTWDRTAEGYQAAIESLVARQPGKLVAIPAYFSEPSPNNETQLDPLEDLWGKD
jgi:sucrose-phosphate synthase